MFDLEISTSLERAGGVLAGEVEDEIGGGDQPGRVTGEDRLMDEILGEQRLTEAVGRDDDHVFALREKVEREDAFDRRPMELGRPGPFKIGQRFEAAESRIVEPAFDALVKAGRELGLCKVFEEHDGAPALLGGAGDQIVELARGVAEPQLSQVISQCRRNRVE